jgi:guanylate kinase
MLFVISAPSGAGKTTIIKELFRRNPALKFSVSATTRKIREGEADGKDYYFLSEKEFEEKLKMGEFVEWESVHNYRYGTLKSEIENFINTKSHLVFDVDVKGALSLKRIYPDAVIIFIDVPFEQLMKRLKNRNTESEDQIKKRSERIEMELTEIDKFDYIIDNSDKAGGLEKAVNEINEIINKY